MADPVEPIAEKISEVVAEVTEPVVKAAEAVAAPEPVVVKAAAPAPAKKTPVKKAAKPAKPAKPVVTKTAAPVSKAVAKAPVAKPVVAKAAVAKTVAAKPAPKIKTPKAKKPTPVKTPVLTVAKTPIKTPAKIIPAPLARTAAVIKKAPSIMTTTTEKFQTVIKDASAKAKAAFEKSQANLGEMGEFTKGNVEAVVESTKILATGLQAMTKGYAAESKSAFETLTAEMKSLATVKTPSELLEKQSSLMRAHFDAAVAASSKNSEAMLKLANEVFQPISNRVSLAVEKIKQAA